LSVTRSTYLTASTHGDPANRSQRGAPTEGFPLGCAIGHPAEPPQHFSLTPIRVAFCFSQLQNIVSTKIREDCPVSASKTFLRFAAECEAMASFARDPESRLTWQGFAARWSRYAESVETRFTRTRVGKMRRPQRRSKVNLSIDDEVTPTDIEPYTT
jgi:hypothetical protein